MQDDEKTLEEMVSERILHFHNDTCKAYVERVKGWCAEEGISDAFQRALDYVRTYSGGGEGEWKTVLSLDLPHHEESRNFIACIYKRVHARDTNYYDDVSGLRHFMTIGMIWYPHEKAWGFHS